MSDMTSLFSFLHTTRGEIQTEKEMKQWYQFQEECIEDMLLSGYDFTFEQGVLLFVDYTHAAWW